MYEFPLSAELHFVALLTIWSTCTLVLMPAQSALIIRRQLRVSSKHRLKEDILSFETYSTAITPHIQIHSECMLSKYTQISLYSEVRTKFSSFFCFFFLFDASRALTHREVLLQYCFQILYNRCATVLILFSFYFV